MTDEKILPFSSVASMDLPPTRILDAAFHANLQALTIIGWDQDGEFYFTSSKANRPDLLWLLETAKKKLMDEQ